MMDEDILEEDVFSFLSLQRYRRKLKPNKLRKKRNFELQIFTVKKTI